MTVAATIAERAMALIARIASADPRGSLVYEGEMAGEWEQEAREIMAARTESGVEEEVRNSARALARRVQEWKAIRDPGKDVEQLIIDAAERVFEALAVPVSEIANDLPDPACHRTGWSAEKIDGIWCVGMTGNLDTVHDAVVHVNRHGSDEGAEAIAKWIATTYTAALSAKETPVLSTQLPYERARDCLAKLLIEKGHPLVAEDVRLSYKTNIGSALALEAMVVFAADPASKVERLYDAFTAGWNVNAPDPDSAAIAQHFNDWLEEKSR